MKKHRPSHAFCKMVHASNRAEERYGVKNVFKLETAIRVILSNDSRDKYVFLGDSRFIFKIDNKEYCVVYHRKSQTLVTFLPPKSLGTLANPDWTQSTVYKTYLVHKEKLDHLQNVIQVKELEIKNANEKVHELFAFEKAYNYAKALTYSKHFNVLEHVIFAACMRGYNKYQKHSVNLCHLETKHKSLCAERDSIIELINKLKVGKK